MAMPLRVLFVEDQESDLELLVLELRRGGFDVAHERVETPEAFVAALDRGGWDLILCDYNLPHFSAPAALALVKEKQIDLPFIVVSGAVSEEAAVEALRAGAHDFMAKSKLSRLLPAIDRELRDAESRAEQKKTQELLIDAARGYDELQRASTARLLLMFENVPVVLYTYAVEESGRFRFTSVNPAFLAATGLTEDAVVGRLVDEVVPEPSLSLVLGKYRDAIRERATVRWIETTPYPTGTKVAEVTITPLFDDAGRCTELFGTVYDLTEIQQIKEELRASEEQKAELAVLNRRLDEATRAKSEFLANMSHELRTPLNAILGFAALLREQGDAVASKRERYLDHITDAGEHLLALINDVLDLSKVEAGKLELRPDRTTVAALAGPGVAAAMQAAEAGGVAFAAHLDGDSVVRVDADRVRQVLFNLLSNAVKFTPAGGHASLRVAANGPDLEIAVSDTGIGIPLDRQDRVFGAFERLNEDRSDVAGTGLGLALTKQIVELHGGSIDFDSSPGLETTFRVRLPGVVEERIDGTRVLVVEDEARDAELVAALAARHGLRVEIVGTVAGGCEALERGTPLAMVLDLRLPDGRGEDVLERLRGSRDGGTVPVAVVTVEDDAPRARALGAALVMTKPLAVQTLADWFARLDGTPETVLRQPGTA